MTFRSRAAISTSALLFALPLGAFASVTVYDFTATTTENTPITLDFFALGLDGYSSSADYSQFSLLGYANSNGTGQSNPHFAPGGGTLVYPDPGSGVVTYTPIPNWLSTENDPYDVLWYRIFDAPNSGSNIGLVKFVVVAAAPPDTTAPVISVLGDNPLSLTVGDTFTDPGFTATDDMAVTASSTSGSVDTATAGSYTLTYTASDAVANTSVATRTVTVAAAPVIAPVEIASSGGGGGSFHRRKLATTTPPGEVLGASAYYFARQLGRGDTGPDVVQLQQFLATTGLYTGPVTGYLGQLTHRAVLAFQKSKGVVGANGHVGPLTLALLNAGNIATSLNANLQSQLAAAYSALTALMALVKP